MPPRTPQEDIPDPSAPLDAETSRPLRYVIRRALDAGMQLRAVLAGRVGEIVLGRKQALQLQIDSRERVQVVPRPEGTIFLMPESVAALQKFIGAQARDTIDE